MVRSTARRRVGVVTALVMLLGLIGITGLPAAAADSSVTLSKEVSSSTARPGDEFFYTLTLSCSGLTTDCIGATLTDVLPAGLEVTSPPVSTPEQSVTYDEASRTLSVAYLIPLASPPNPAGSVGLPAGTTRKVVIGVRVPTETPLLDGDVLTNTATFGGSNTNTAEASASTTVIVPVVVRPVATKTWQPDSAIAQSGAESTMTLGIRNASSSSAQVTALTLTDIAVPTFEHFDVTRIGPVVYPPGTDAVTIEYLIGPGDCTPGDPTTVTEGPLTGDLSGYVPGVELANVVGLLFRFVDQGGAVIPASPDQGTVAVGLRLRDTVRSTCATFAPTERQRIENLVSPSAQEGGDPPVGGTPATAGYDVNPNTVGVDADKAFCPDTNNDFTCDGIAIAGQGSGVTMNLGADNVSGFPVGQITITEPDPDFPALPNPLLLIDLAQIRYSAPATTQSTTITVQCRDAAGVPQAGVVVGPLGAATGTLPNPCPTGQFPLTVSTTFDGLDGDGAPTIADGSRATLGLTGAWTEAAPAGSYENCAKATVSSGVDGTGAAFAQACATTTVQPPSETGSGTKSSGQVSTIVPGQELEFTITYRNTGNLPTDNLIITDPAGLPDSIAPYDVVALTSVTPQATPPSTIELWDPTPSPGQWVDLGDIPLADAGGFRVIVDGQLAPGATFRVTYKVVVRDDVPVGTTFKNCVSIEPTGLTDPFCNNNELVVGVPTTAGSVNKAFVPSTLERPWPGQSPAARPTTDLRLQVANDGTLYMDRLVLTDTYRTSDAAPAFWDSFDYVGDVRVDFPPGADRVRLDACTLAPPAQCSLTSDAGWTLGTPTPARRPGLPAGVSAAQVRGFRVTFDRTDGAYLLTPGRNWAGGICPGSSVCVRVAPRLTLASTGEPVPQADPATPFLNTVSATGRTIQQGPGDPDYPIGQAAATVNLVDGPAALGISKTPDSRIAPGDTAPFYLTIENTGRRPIPDLRVGDVVPKELFLEAVPGAGTALYTVTYTVPTGTPTPPTVDFTTTEDPEDANRVASATWQFPGWEFLPGAKIVITLQARLAPGVAADVQAINEARVTTDAPGLPFTCSYDASTTIDGQLYCTSTATVVSLEGTSFDANKWSAGRDDLGFYNTLTGQVHPTSDNSCPRLVAGGRTYTRYPCVALNYAGQGFDFLLRLTNASNNAIARNVRLMDTLPVKGDSGVLLVDQQRGTEWSTPPRLISAPEDTSVFGFLATSYTSDDTVAEDLCFELIGGQTAPAGCTPGDWSATYPDDRADISAWRGTLVFPRTLGPGQSALVSFRVDSPLDLEDPTAVPVAWNSFAHEDFLILNPGTLILPPTEPIKAGIGVLYGKVSVEKAVTGAPPAGLDLTSFPVRYECTATQEQPGGSQGAAQVVASGTVTVGSGQAVEVPELVPAGATCRFWEDAPKGAISNAPSKDQALVVVVEPSLRPGQSEPAPAQVVRISNDYPLGGLILTKQVAGSGARFSSQPFVFDVVCTFEGLEVRRATVTLTSPDQLSTTLTGINVGSSCTITERAPYGGADGPAAFSPPGPYVIADSPTPITVTATNTFTAGRIVVSKVVQNGDPDAGPFTFQVACTRPQGEQAVPVELPDGGVLQLNGGESGAFEVPLGSTCTVVEVGVDAEVIVTVEDSDSSTPGGDADGVVVVTAAAPEGSVTVTNTLPDGVEEGGEDEDADEDLAVTGPRGAVNLLLVGLGLVFAGAFLTRRSRRWMA